MTTSAFLVCRLQRGCSLSHGSAKSKPVQDSFPEKSKEYWWSVWSGTAHIWLDIWDADSNSYGFGSWSGQY